jgi:hypothetical protein
MNEEKGAAHRNIYSLDNVLNTEGAAHRNIFIMANPAFSVALNIYLDIQKLKVSATDLYLVTMS